MNKQNTQNAITPKIRFGFPCKRKTHQPLDSLEPAFFILITPNPNTVHAFIWSTSRFVVVYSLYAEMFKMSSHPRWFVYTFVVYQHRLILLRWLLFLLSLFFFSVVSLFSDSNRLKNQRLNASAQFVVFSAEFFSIIPIKKKNKIYTLCSFSHSFALVHRHGL